MYGSEVLLLKSPQSRQAAGRRKSRQDEMGGRLALVLDWLQKHSSGVLPAGVRLVVVKLRPVQNAPVSQESLKVTMLCLSVLSDFQQGVLFVYYDKQDDRHKKNSNRRKCSPLPLFIGR